LRHQREREREKGGGERDREREGEVLCLPSNPLAGPRAESVKVAGFVGPHTGHIRTQRERIDREESGTIIKRARKERRQVLPLIERFGLLPCRVHSSCMGPHTERILLHIERDRERRQRERQERRNSDTVRDRENRHGSLWALPVDSVAGFVGPSHKTYTSKQREGPRETAERETGEKRQRHG
jgi:hypothetical protein